MLDTGSPYSVVHPLTLRRLKVEVASAFAGRETTRVRGIGGWSDFFVDEAIVSFEHDAGGVIGYRFDEMRFAVPTDYNADYPSLLGMDFIGAFELLLNSNEDRVELR
jgi:hypothetical protein